MLGTWNSLILVDADSNPGLKGKDLDSAASSAFSLMQRYEEELSKFDPDSEVSLMNSLAASQRVGVSSTLWELLILSKKFWEVSRGTFDPSIAPLMQAWGFDSGHPRVPTESELQSLRAICGFENVSLFEEDSTVSFKKVGVSIDLGAIGKGWIVDRVVEHLQELGVHSGALISGRSTIVCWGQAPQERSWRIGVANPFEPDEPLVELEIESGAISSTAVYEKQFEYDGKTYGHVIDPRTSQPIDSCLAVTVWTPKAVEGDAASTALFVLGRTNGEEVLPDFGRVSALVVEEDSSSWGGLKSTELYSGDPGWNLIR